MNILFFIGCVIAILAVFWAAEYVSGDPDRRKEKIIIKKKHTLLSDFQRTCDKEFKDVR